MSSLLELQGLKVIWRDRNNIPHLIIKNVNLRIDKGETVALVGESGAGKTITALSIVDLMPPGFELYRGTITWKDREVTHSRKELRGKHITMIFQEPSTALNPVLKIGEQLAEVLMYNFKSPKQMAYAEARNMLRWVEFPDPDRIMESYPHQLSGGQKQRVMIAMALLPRPELVIADEPTTSLDTTVQAQIITLLKNMKENLGVSILLITHNLGLVKQLADRTYIMYKGTIVEEGTTERIIKKPLHPYTEGLLEAVPDIEKPPSEELPFIPGNINQEAPPNLCPFFPRCKKSIPECHEDYPMWTSLPDGGVLCHLVARKNLQKQKA